MGLLLFPFWLLPTGLLPLLVAAATADVAVVESDWLVVVDADVSVLTSLLNAEIILVVVVCLAHLTYYV